MFRTVPLSIIRSFSLYTPVPSWSCSQAVSKPVWHIPLLRVQWKTPDDGHRNCPKHVEFYSKNKFEKLVHLVGFIIRILMAYSWRVRKFERGRREVHVQFVERASKDDDLQTAELAGTAMPSGVFATHKREKEEFLNHSDFGVLPTARTGLTLKRAIN